MAHHTRNEVNVIKSRPVFKYSIDEHNLSLPNCNKPPILRTSMYLDHNPYPILTNQYGIHPKLPYTVRKHLWQPFQKPILSLQKHIFENTLQLLHTINKPLILDSGCGTGLSTIRLAQDFPCHFTLGIDRSFVRLKKFTQLQKKYTLSNCAVVRADLIDFWRLLLKAQIPIQKHFILYPNPWPKSSDLKKRWHAHPIFSTLLQLSPYLELRSNWKLYLDEFALSTQIATSVRASAEVLKPTQAPLTPFETKYWNTQCTTYRLVLNQAIPNRSIHKAAQFLADNTPK